MQRNKLIKDHPENRYLPNRADGNVPRWNGRVNADSLSTKMHPNPKEKANISNIFNSSFGEYAFFGKSGESQKFESKRTKIEGRILKKDNRASIFEIYRFPTAKD